jgi:nucleoside-diphosphate-sugar epimerase
LLSYIHVLDIARLYVLLVSDVHKGGSSSDVWGEKADYSVETEEVSFGDYMEASFKVLEGRGVLKSEEIKKVGEMEIPDYWKGFLVIFLGADMRLRASRAKKLGWAPREKRIIEVVRRWLKSQE